MKDSTNSRTTTDRTAKVDARCSSTLKQKLEKIAALRDIDLSDLVREALREKVARFEQQAMA